MSQKRNWHSKGLHFSSLPSGPISMLSTAVHKFGYVFYAASSDTMQAFLILLSKTFKSFRVNFHSNGLAICS